MSTLTIGDTSRDGAFRIAATEWNHNGTLRVTIEETTPGDGLIRELPVEKMRRLARRAIHHPEQTRQSPVIARGRLAGKPGQPGPRFLTFAVSRNER
jgi:hypothetical protein